MPGGTYRKGSASLHGGLAEQAFRAFSFDKLFIGADWEDRHPNHWSWHQWSRSNRTGTTRHSGVAGL